MVSGAECDLPVEELLEQARREATLEQLAEVLSMAVEIAPELEGLTVDEEPGDGPGGKITMVVKKSLRSEAPVGASAASRVAQLAAASDAGTGEPVSGGRAV